MSTNVAIDQYVKKLAKRQAKMAKTAKTTTAKRSLSTNSVKDAWRNDRRGWITSLIGLPREVGENGAYLPSIGDDLTYANVEGRTLIASATTVKELTEVLAKIASHDQGVTNALIDTTGWTDKEPDPIESAPDNTRTMKRAERFTNTGGVFNVAYRTRNNHAQVAIWHCELDMADDSHAPYLMVSAGRNLTALIPDRRTKESRETRANLAERVMTEYID